MVPKRPWTLPSHFLRSTAEGLGTRAAAAWLKKVVTRGPIRIFDDLPEQIVELAQPISHPLATKEVGIIKEEQAERFIVLSGI